MSEETESRVKRAKREVHACLNYGGIFHNGGPTTQELELAYDQGELSDELPQMRRFAAALAELADALEANQAGAASECRGSAADVCWSERALQLVREGGVTIEIEAVVLGTYTFQAEKEWASRVVIAGTRGGPMGHGTRWTPYGFFGLDAGYSVVTELKPLLSEPARIRFQADLKAVGAGYRVHLLKVLPCNAD